MPKDLLSAVAEAEARAEAASVVLHVQQICLQFDQPRSTQMMQKCLKKHESSFGPSAQSSLT
jgi:hypothetical protein